MNVWLSSRFRLLLGSSSRAFSPQVRELLARRIKDAARRKELAEAQGAAATADKAALATWQG